MSATTVESLGLASPDRRPFTFFMNPIASIGFILWAVKRIWLGATDG